MHDKKESSTTRLLVEALLAKVLADVAEVTVAKTRPFPIFSLFTVYSTVYYLQTWHFQEPVEECSPLDIDVAFSRAELSKQI